MDAVLADGLEPGDAGEQRGVLGVHEIGEDMDLGVLVLRGEFGAGNEFQLRRRTGRRRPVAALHRVMIGQGDGGKPQLASAGNQLLGREGAVRKKRVQMEVGEFHFRIRAGRISSPRILSRMPFTNLPLSCVENFLAMSTASLMLTTGGMSSRWSIS